MAARQVQGSFGSYILQNKNNADYPDDEEAVQMALEDALASCGNAGQESMVMEVGEDFWDWALTILEDESAIEGTTWEEFFLMLIEWYGGRTDKAQGTEEIWGQAWVAVAEQSGYHDSKDEYGEGAGREF